MKSNIKKRLICIFSAAVVLAAFSFAQAATETLIRENFENWVGATELFPSTGTVNGWSANSRNDADGIIEVKITSEAAHNSSYGLHLNDNHDTNAATFTHLLGRSITNGSLDFSIKAATTNYNYRVDFFTTRGTKLFDLAIYTPGGNVSGSVGGGLYVRAGTKSEILKGVSFLDAKFSKSDWNQINISFDQSQSSLTVSVGGSLVLELTSAEIGNINLDVEKISFLAGYSNGKGMACYVDDIILTTTTSNVPESSTWAILSGMAALVISLVCRKYVA